MVRTSPELSDRTFGNEDGLPRVPLPTPQESCERFLAWCAPLLDGDQLAATETAVAEFLAAGSPAHELHAALQDFDARDGVASWLDTFWPYRYLGRRDRIALNANFFFLFEDSPLGQVERAAALVAAAVDYKLLIDDERLPPATLRGQPLSMQQNRFLFSSTRIPGVELDTVRTPYTDAWPGPSRERHIVVFVRGTMLRVEVIAPDGRPHTVDELASGLRAALAAAPESGPGVGHLTTKARAEWAASRAALIEAGNADALDTIERALFCLSLEGSTPADALAASDQLLHGDSANRWFDKGATLIVFADGTAGFNGEHCELDGTTVVSFLDAILEAPQAVPGGTATPSVVPIDFTLDDALRADIAAAGADFAAYAAATATTTLSLDFSAERAKALKCSPDAFAQMAFQLAHQRAKGHIGATYESIATRSFKHGRTEAMRVVTPEVVAFVTAMDDPAATAGTRRAAFRAAADAHVARAKECQAGRAPEQHLWELQLIAKRRGDTAPIALYDSPGWRVMRDDYLSTSAVPSPHISFFGFGSTSEKCIGIGYAMMPGRFDLYLSTPRAVSEQMETFAARLPDAVRELEELLGDDR
ncbi:choline/carnitine O-acyltransferase [Pseudonocardia sp.]|uniref:choline/carnitine O-acyltransferase n=1 Tax=Pseudonocardia sp. TaxID=60912 RepID=UPI0026305658|nr:choline/carnitine O-acyltransferase [Pseudonocardia sp.]